ncbi:hypothetical protein [Flavobacterium sp.]|uniref:hypothetical protein n=1 Tax=Flavobacterium sp. TaxID=239 RepID=UPI0012035C34|nr:hypothetical protein [Flavobacterium sp.]RZJ73531.1 MAG: hypothetical protein EOO49_01580 [Flavobacterium sp.]
MKKILLFTLLAVAMNSCSSDDSGNQPTQGGTLLASTIQTAGSDSYTTNYSYNGNKIASSVNVGGDTTLYTYSGNAITGIEVQNSAGSTSYEFDFTYSNGRLAEAKRTQTGTGIVMRQTFSYPNATSITGQTFLGNATSQTQLLYDQVYTIGQDGEVSTVANTANGTTTIYSYTYDAKNNPFKNVVGWSDLLLLQGVNHNILTSVSPSGSEEIVYQYNQDDYPSVSTRTSTGSTPIVTTYTYQ